MAGSLLAECLSHVPSDRPDAGTVYNKLSELLQSSDRLQSIDRNATTAVLQNTIDLKVSLPKPEEVCAFSIFQVDEVTERHRFGYASNVRRTTLVADCVPTLSAVVHDHLQM